MGEEWKLVEVPVGLFHKTKMLTFKNKTTGKFCAEKFVEAYYVGRGVYQVKQKNSYYTLFNARTGEISNIEFFDKVPAIPGHILSLHFREGKESFWRLYSLDTNFLFSKKTEYSQTLEQALEAHPEDFEHVPMDCFRDKDLIQRCLDAMAKGVKVLCSEKGSSKDVEDYTKDVYKMISEKIEKEKKNIEKEQEEYAQFEEERLKKFIVADKAAEGIRNLGGKE